MSAPPAIGPAEVPGPRRMPVGRRPPGTWRPGWLVVVVVLLGVLVACGGDDGGTGRAGGDAVEGDEGTGDRQETADDGDPVDVPEPVEVPADDPEALYTEPDPIPDVPPGTLLRHQPSGTTAEGMTLHRILYASETPGGQPTIVTGIVAVPEGGAPQEGWPVLTHGHGSTGLADDCAPSMAFGTAADTGIRTAEQHLVIREAASAGFVVASSDYEGQGGPGRHPFLVGVSEARSLLDAARAAGGLPGVEVDGRLAIAGYSQGGHAALWARQLAGEWAPELEVIGTVAGAPVTRVGAMAAGDVPPGSGAVSLTLAAGLDAADPALGLDDLLTPEGAAALEAMDASCEADATAPPGTEMLDVDITTDGRWPGRLEANDPGATPGTGPLLAVHSQVDETVPVGDSELLLDRLCPQGVDVELRVLPDGDHVLAAVPTYEQGVAWLARLADGAAPGSDCP